VGGSNLHESYSTLEITSRLNGVFQVAGDDCVPGKSLRGCADADDREPMLLKPTG